MITKGGGAEAAGRQAEAGQDQRQGERAAGGRRASEPGGGVVVILAGTVIARPPVVPGHDADLPAGSPLTRPGSPVPVKTVCAGRELRSPAARRWASSARDRRTVFRGKTRPAPTI